MPTHCDNGFKTKLPSDNVYAADSVFVDLSAFHRSAVASIPDALAGLSRSKPALALQAAPVGTQLKQRIHLQANNGSILNHTQALIVGLRTTYAVPRATNDAVTDMVSDPKFEPNEIGTNYVKKQERKLPKGFDGGNVSVFNMREEMDSGQDVQLFLRCIKYVIKCIFGDEAYANSMCYTFHPVFDENGDHTFGSAMCPMEISIDLSITFGSAMGPMEISIDPSIQFGFSLSLGSASSKEAHKSAMLRAEWTITARRDSWAVLRLAQIKKIDILSQNAASRTQFFQVQAIKTGHISIM